MWWIREAQNAHVHRGSVYLTAPAYWLSTPPYTIHTVTGVSYLRKAAVANYHTPSGSEEHIFTSTQFWKSEGQHQFHWVRVRYWQGWFFLEALQGESVYLLFSAASGCPYFLVYGPFPRLQSTSIQSLFPSSHFFYLTRPVSLWLDWTYQNNPGQSFHFKILNVTTFARAPFTIYWVGFIPGIQGLFNMFFKKKIKAIHQINRLRKKMTWSYQSVQKKYDKIPYSFMIKLSGKERGTSSTW